MGRLLKLLPYRRLELGLTALLTAAMLALIWLTRASATSTQLALIGMELLLPMILGLVAAGLLAGDPAIDLLLSVPQPAPRTLAQRLAIVLACGLLLETSLQGLSGFWEIPLPISGGKQFLIWATPLTFYAGLATASALVRGRPMDGLAAVVGAWGLSLLSFPFIGQACEQSATTSCPAALFTPALTLIWPAEPIWTTNRLLWLGAGVLLLGIGLIQASREERLLAA